jgi:hypothetical protein
LGILDGNFERRRLEKDLPTSGKRDYVYDG